MAGLFDLAADRALHMSQPPPPKISIAIGIGQPLMGMAGGGGLSSVQKKMNIGGQPHKLAYINSDEASLLKQMGGLGEPVEGTRGVPAYIGVTDQSAESYDADVGGYGAAYGGFDPGGPTPEQAAVAKAEEDAAAAKAAQETAATEEETSGLLGLGILTPENFQNFLGRLGAGALGSVVGGPLGGFIGYQYGPEMYEWAKKEGHLDWMPDLDFKGDPESPDFKDTIDEFPTEPDPEDEEEEEEVEDEEEEDEELTGMARYWADKKARGRRDPYEGYEYILEDVYGKDWRDRLKEGII